MTDEHLMLRNMTLRELQTESARALVVIGATNNNIKKFNVAAHHNSQLWYKEVITWYIHEYGDLPSKCGPGITVKLVLE